MQCVGSVDSQCSPNAFSLAGKISQVVLFSSSQPHLIPVSPTVQVMKLRPSDHTHIEVTSGFPRSLFWVLFMWFCVP